MREEGNMNVNNNGSMQAFDHLISHNRKHSPMIALSFRSQSLGKRNQRAASTHFGLGPNNP